MSSDPFICDGYTETKVISSEATPKLFDDFLVTFRPVEVLEQAAFFDRVEKLDSEKTRRETAKMMAGKIQSWTLGKDPTVANLLALRPAIFNALWNVISGYVAGGEADAKN